MVDIDKIPLVMYNNLYYYSFVSASAHLLSTMVRKGTHGAQRNPLLIINLIINEIYLIKLMVN